MSGPSTHQVNLGWIIRLRWASIAGQAVTIGVVAETQRVSMPLAALAGLVAFEIVTNLACVVLRRRARDVRELHLAAVMGLDVLILTGLLYLTGGPQNPFSFVYLVQIALAAMILRPRWTWMLVGLSLAGSAVLFVDHRPFPISARTHAEHMALHTEGMWVAFGVCASFIVYFLMRVGRELTVARAQTERDARLGALATLAAGAAHELNTPLSTIALVARELERSLEGREPALLDDVRLVRTQVERCREILTQMAADAGATSGEALTPQVPAEILREATAGLAPIDCLIEDSAEAARILAPRKALAQALRGLCQNALDASADVNVSVSVERGRVRFVVADRGPGMAPDVLARAGEPFFTTKPPGRGMGLGLFLSRTIVERLGGELRLDSRPDEGTTATATIPSA